MSPELHQIHQAATSQGQTADAATGRGQSALDVCFTSQSQRNLHAHSWLLMLLLSVLWGKQSLLQGCSCTLVQPVASATAALIRALLRSAVDEPVSSQVQRG
ncbi:uncharacterized protein V6R79_008512 [Siganus canaliculatus]